MTSTIQSLSKVILPVIRQVMPNLIAQSIVGVQPMTGQTGMIYSMKARYADYYDKKIKLNIEHYNKFLRLYNRRKFTYHDDIIAAGYFCCEGVYDEDILTWCNENFGKYGYIYHNSYITMFYFENINDQTLFKMRWL